MPQVEVYTAEDEIKPLFEAEFAFLPRVGELVSKDAGGYFDYYKVVVVWHRQDFETGRFHACLRVELDD
jgi:hypothetical protein